MNCARARQSADRFFRGDTTSGEERKLNRHLTGCRGCRDWFETADPIRIFRGLETPSRGDRFWADFWPRVRADIEATVAPAAWWSLGWRPAAALATGILSVAILIGAWNLFRGDSQPDGVPMAARSAGRQEPPGLVRHTAMPTMESYPSAESRVFIFRLEEPSGPPTEVILIFDESIDL